MIVLKLLGTSIQGNLGKRINTNDTCTHDRADVKADTLSSMHFKTQLMKESVSEKMSQRMDSFD